MFGRRRLEGRRRDPGCEEVYPPDPSFRREVREFVRNLGKGVVVFAVLGTLAWIGYRELVSPFYGKAVLALGFERGRQREDLVEDLRFARTALEEHHPALFLYQSREEMEHEFDRVEEALRDGDSAADLLRAAAPLVAAVGCGHTGLRASMSSVRATMSGGRFLPFGVRFIEGRSYLVYHYDEGVGVPRGAEILAIDGRPMREILEILVTSLPSDRRDRTYSRALAEAQFLYWYWVLVDRGSRATMRYRDPRDGRELEQEVRARPVRRVIESYRRQHPELDPYRRPPPMRAEVFPSRGVAYLRLYTFARQHRPDGDEVLRSFFAELADHDVETLVVDVRGNAGGPPPVSVSLLRYLLTEPFVYLDEPRRPEHRALGYDRYYREFEPHEKAFAGRLVVLIDGGSFSTTGHFLAHLAARDRALFVGTRSGGGALCHDGSRHLELPHSGLRLRVATRPFRAAVGEGFPDRGIEPHHRVARRVEDLVAGRDTVLAYLRMNLGIDLSPLGEPESL